MPNVSCYVLKVEDVLTQHNIIVNAEKCNIRLTFLLCRLHVQTKQKNNIIKDSKIR